MCRKNKVNTRRKKNPSIRRRGKNPMAEKKERTKREEDVEESKKEYTKKQCQLKGSSAPPPLNKSKHILSTPLITTYRENV